MARNDAVKKESAKIRPAPVIHSTNPESGRSLIDKCKSGTVEEIKTSEEVFVTGTMGELTPVNRIDDYVLKNKIDFSYYQEINKLFKDSIKGLSENAV